MLCGSILSSLLEVRVKQVTVLSFFGFVLWVSLRNLQKFMRSFLNLNSETNPPGLNSWSAAVSKLPAGMSFRGQTRDFQALDMSSYGIYVFSLQEYHRKSPCIDLRWLGRGCMSQDPFLDCERDIWSLSSKTVNKVTNSPPKALEELSKL